MHPISSSAPALPGQRSFELSDFDFDLPEALIAQHPPAVRSDSRLLDGRPGPVVDRGFRELPQLLEPGDLLVFNDTRVLKARLYGAKPSGGRVELLIERVLSDHEVVAHLRASKKPAVGVPITLDGEPGFEATVLGRWPEADGPLFRLRLTNAAGESPYVLMERHGHVPLPPYITHGDSPLDAERYQTVFARVPGAIAAPTASLHFDQDVLDALHARGVERTNVTLHVGAGTFQPVKVTRIDEHQMHSERYSIPAETLAAIAATRARGGRVVAAGTTTLRTLESWALTGDREGDTRLFIRPGFRFQVVDLLVTNFHLPCSTLMMLVSAFAGYERIMALYRHAIEQRYRFFSYGDAMLLQREAGAPGKPHA